jgi:hypothetical protein
MRRPGIKIYKPLIVGLIGTLIARDAFSAEQVLYCSADMTAGFTVDSSTKRYAYTQFKDARFTVKFSEDGKSLTVTAPHIPNSEIHVCSRPFPGGPIMCVEKYYMMNFDASRTRFIRAQAYGNLMDNPGDSVSIAMGSCAQF